MRIYVAVLVAFVGTFVAIAEGYQYDAHGRRDPFVPLVGQERPAFAKLEDVESIDEIKLEGIATGKSGEKVAIINGQMFKEKSVVGNVEIKEITRKYVTISLSGKVYKITLSSEGGVKSEQ